MDSEQPYRPPQAELTAPSVRVESGQITSGMIHQLNRTRPWVRFIGVLMIIGCVFLLLGGVLMMFLGGLTDMGQTMGPIGGIFLGALYLLMAVLYYFPARYLLRYGTAIKQMQGGTSAPAMEEALRHQASFWRFMGILAAAVMVVYGLILAVALVFGTIAALTG